LEKQRCSVPPAPSSLQKVYEPAEHLPWFDASTSVGEVGLEEGGGSAAPQLELPPSSSSESESESAVQGEVSMASVSSHSASQAAPTGPAPLRSSAVHSVLASSGLLSCDSLKHRQPETNSVSQEEEQGVAGGEEIVTSNFWPAEQWEPTSQPKYSLESGAASDGTVKVTGDEEPRLVCPEKEQEEYAAESAIGYTLWLPDQENSMVSPGAADAKRAEGSTKPASLGGGGGWGWG
jgi:hypothetical protein